MTEPETAAGAFTGAACVALLQWALPQLGLRYRGFRNVRGQVCKRIRRRAAELGLSDAAAYRARLEADPDEWRVLRGLCAVTISRFYRDRRLWDALRARVLPALAEAVLAAGEGELRVWSVGCASGEEPYTLSLAWQLDVGLRYPRLGLCVVATDAGATVLERARDAVYAPATLRELPPAWVVEAFEPCGEALHVSDRFRAPVELRREDVRDVLPGERFHLVLCRNSVFTYFDEAAQRETSSRLLSRLSPGGVLTLGAREHLPDGAPFEPFDPELAIPCYVAARSLPDA